MYGVESDAVFESVFMTVFRLVWAKWLLLMLCILSGKVLAAEYLPPEQAFPFQVTIVNQSGTKAVVQVEFKIASGYYMYRDEFAFTVVSPDGRVTQNGGVKMPPAQVKFDENFGKDVAYYHNALRLNVPIKLTGESEAAFKIVVASRGCADQGLCYPPRKNQVVLRITPTAGTNDARLSNAASANTSAGSADSAHKQSPAGSNDEVSINSSAQGNTHSSEQLSPVIEIKPSNSTAGLNDGATADTAVRIEPSGATSAASAASKTLDNSSFAGNLFAQNHIVWALLVVFGLGLLLSLTPCMFPMFPILTVLLAGQQREQSRWHGFALALAYVSGMAVVYALIGVVAARTGLALQSYLQNPWVLLGFAALLVLLALSMFDVFQIQMSARWQAWLQAKTQGKNGYWGAWIMGAASALIASPCVTAPLVGLISYIAQTGQVTLGGLALLVLAYGMGVPLLLLGAGLGQWLPKSGAWMTRVKNLIGVMMLGVAVWVAQPVWGKYWNALTTQGATQSSAFERVYSLSEIQARVMSSDKPVLIDLYADWCRSCIEMEHKTFSDPQIAHSMQDFQLLRVDMTQNTAQDTEILKHFGLYGPPGIIVLEGKTGREKGRVVGFESPAQFGQSLQQMK